MTDLELMMMVNESASMEEVHNKLEAKGISLKRTTLTTMVSQLRAKLNPPIAALNLTREAQGAAPIPLVKVFRVKGASVEDTLASLESLFS